MLWGAGFSLLFSYYKCRLKPAPHKKNIVTCSLVAAMQLKMLITHELPPYTAHQAHVIPAGIAGIQCIGMYGLNN